LVERLDVALRDDASHGLVELFDPFVFSRPDVVPGPADRPVNLAARVHGVFPHDQRGPHLDALQNVLGGLVVSEGADSVLFRPVGDGIEIQRIGCPRVRPRARQKDQHRPAPRCVPANDVLAADGGAAHVGGHARVLFDQLIEGLRPVSMLPALERGGVEDENADDVPGSYAPGDLVDDGGKCRKLGGLGRCFGRGARRGRM